MPREASHTAFQAYTILLGLATKLGMPPTAKQFAKALRLKSRNSACRYLEILESEGYIRRWDGARGMAIKGWTPPKVGARTNHGGSQR